MGLFSAKKQAPTAVNLAGYSRPTQPPVDPEKGTADERDVAEGGAQQHRVDPSIEKRVVRKLDLTVTPLVAGLCKCSKTFSLMLTDRIPSLALVPRSRKHRQCQNCWDGQRPRLDFG